MNNPSEKMSILFVEPDRLERERIAPFLAKHFDRFAMAFNGDEALEIYEKVSPDIVVVALETPKIDGIQLAKEIRHVDEDVGIILTAPYRSEYSVFETVDARLDAVVKRPIKASTMMNQIDRLSRKLYVRKIQENTRASSAQYLTALEEEGLLIHLDSKGNITRLSRRADARLAYPYDALIEEPFEELLYPGQQNYRSLLRAIEWGDRWSGHLKLRSGMEEILEFEASLIPIYEIDRSSRRYLLMLEDRTELIKCRERMKEFKMAL